MKRAIEEYFPIVDINRLAVPERNAFKPIYTMHKWFARRSSSVFRAILLGALKPAGTDIMAEFYKDHTNDPDTKGRVILDPFMGGGTTVVEALRLGCKVIGIDLNPVAWFIVKTEVEPVDLNELQAAFDRLAARSVGWSAKPLKETLLSLYKTQCPACGNADADIIYTFWVKSAPCTTATCTHQTPLFSDYIISQKKPSIRYFPDCECPGCQKTFDWEREPAALVGDPVLMVNAGKFSAGEGRTSARWAYSRDETVICPWCEVEVRPNPRSLKLVRKKVPLSVLYCPACEEVWQFRGDLTETVECPSCRHVYNPHEGNLPDKGKFLCRGTCGGNVDAIISAIRKLPEGELLPIRPYAVEAYCMRCAGAKAKDEDDEAEKKFFELGEDADDDEDELPDTSSLLSKNSGKFFKRISAVDFALYKRASETWEREKPNLLYPRSEIPLGEKTKSGLLAHHYRFWHQMFNPRQLLALSTVLKAVDEEPDHVMKEMLLLTFSHSLEANNMFTRTLSKRNTPGGTPPGGIFSRHDYQPKVTSGEQNVFGTVSGQKTLRNCWEKVIQGKAFNLRPYDRIVEGGKQIEIPRNERVCPDSTDLDLRSQSSTAITTNRPVDFVITDPPYASNVNYSELADFFYVWIRLVLKNTYQAFLPEYTPKAEEIIENPTREKSTEDFKVGLQKVFQESHRVSTDIAPLVFTFHHSEDEAWGALLDALCEAGYYIEAVYPVHGEAENSMHLMENKAISYDLIHVCRKRQNSSGSTTRSWASIRQEVRQRAREEIRLIESGRYGNEPLNAADIRILLIGKCLELYSKHYGGVVDHKDEPVPLRRALQEINILVDQLVSKDQPLPPELEDIDYPSKVYFITLCTKKEIKSDDVSKVTRGYIDPAVLRERGLIRKGREKRGRTFEVKQPIERLNELKEVFFNGAQPLQEQLFEDDANPRVTKDILFVDYVHFLLGLAEAGENVLPWLEKFRRMRPQLRAALDYLAQRNKNFAPQAKKVVGLMDERTLFMTQG
jgi:putative DNA methylase